MSERNPDKLIQVCRDLMGVQAMASIVAERLQKRETLTRTEIIERMEQINRTLAEIIGRIKEHGEERTRLAVSLVEAVDQFLRHNDPSWGEDDDSGVDLGNLPNFQLPN